ncbi:MAG: hypothetical protein R6W70_08170 [bacterium]
MAKKTKHTHEEARRFARVIVSDISLYNREKVEKGIMNDSVFSDMKEEIKEGHTYYRSLVDIKIYNSSNYFNEAVVDILIKPFSHLESKIW